MAEITECPSCQRKLQVPETLLGQDVQCPTCGATFTAKIPGRADVSSAPPPAYREPEPDYERPISRYGSEAREAPDDYGRFRSRRDLVPHRGSMILTFGILSFVVCPIFGLCAWIMGNSDLAEIRAGRMDPEGEGLTNAGRICGIISVALSAVACLCYGLMFAGMMAGGGRGFR